MTRDSFIFYRSFKNGMRGLNDNERLQVYDAIVDFCLDNKTKQCTGFAQNIMDLIMPQLIVNQKKHDKGQKGKIYGGLGGRPKKQNPNVDIKAETQNNPNGVLNNETQNQNNIEQKTEQTEQIKPELNFDKPKRQPRIFKRPTVEEIKEYCKEMNYHIDAENFFDFYEAKGWHIGKDMMKDWKAAVRTWEKNWKERQTSITITSSPQLQITTQTDNNYEVDF